MEYITVKDAAEQWDISERMIRKYCEQGQIEGAIHAGSLWVIPVDATRPNSADKSTILKPLANKVAYQKSKNNHFGIYEYLQVNLAYSSSRMASNRLTREQVIEIYRTGKISVAVEPMKIDDLVEIVNHFRAGQYMVDTITEPITTVWFRRLHHKLFRGTRADQEGALHIGEYRTTPGKFGVDASAIPAALSALIAEYEIKKEIKLKDILDFHARFETIHPFEDGNGRVGRMLLVKECLRHGIDPFIIDDKHRGEYNRGIASWSSNPAALTAVAEQAQARFRNQKETLNLMEYCRPPIGRGAR
jgi:Fic family protein